MGFIKNFTAHYSKSCEYIMWKWDGCKKKNISFKIFGSTFSGHQRIPYLTRKRQRVMALSPLEENIAQGWIMWFSPNNVREHVSFGIPNFFLVDISFKLSVFFKISMHYRAESVISMKHGQSAIFRREPVDMQNVNFIKHDKSETIGTRQLKYVLYHPADTSMNLFQG